MTHGALTIIAPDGRELPMHTYHTAMDIPNTVEAAPVKWLEARFGFIVDMKYPRKKELFKARFLESCVASGVFQPLNYPPTVAALLCSVHVGFLEPVAGFQTDLTCGCMKHTDRLFIDNHKWRLESQWLSKEGVKTLEIDIPAILFNYAWKLRH